MDKTFGIKVSEGNYFDRQGAYAIIIHENKIATVRTSKGNFLLGGGHKINENHKDCIIRECLEETGYTLLVNDYICSAETYTFHEKHHYFHPIQYYYRCELKDKIQDTIEKDHKIEWISLDDLEKKMYLIMQTWAVNYALTKDANNLKKETN